jgi:hypothetical protein
MRVPKYWPTPNPLIRSSSWTPYRVRQQATRSGHTRASFARSLGSLNAGGGLNRASELQGGFTAIESPEEVKAETERLRVLEPAGAEGMNFVPLRGSVAKCGPRSGGTCVCVVQKRKRDRLHTKRKSLILHVFPVTKRFPGYEQG